MYTPPLSNRTWMALVLGFWLVCALGGLALGSGLAELLHELRPGPPL
jgi:hypothetical protein